MSQQAHRETAPTQASVFLATIADGESFMQRARCRSRKVRLRVMKPPNTACATVLSGLFSGVFSGVLAAVLLGLPGGASAVCSAQAYTPPPPPLTTLPPCPEDKNAKKRAKRKDCDPTVYPSETIEVKEKKAEDVAPASTPPAEGTAAQKFPFPGEQPASPQDQSTSPGEPPAARAPVAKRFPYPGDAPAGAAQDPAAAAKAAETPAGKAFPFPQGATPDLPADAAPNAPRQRPEADGSSSSSSSSADGSAPQTGADSGSSSSSDDNAEGKTGNGSRRFPTKNPDDDDEDKPKLTDKGSEGKRSKKVVKPQTDTERVDDDLSVARFYGQSGNYMGAYLRAKDAVKTQPDFAEGHFALGEAAKRLKKKDEAVAEFQTYLKLSPDGEKAKTAEKALEELK